jgi:hypothetical protein
MLARLKTDTVEVWQYVSPSMPAWVARYTVWHTNTDNDGLFLVRKSGKQRIEVNEWLIRDLDGDPMWMTNEEFDDEYEIIDD